VCGIFGIVSPDRQDLVQRLRGLFLLSESRGKEAAGLALIDGGTISVLKQPTAASQLVRQQSYLSLLESVCANPRGGPVTVIGHSRLVTNGMEVMSANNQPVICDGLVGIHNGIICNDAMLWERYPGLHRNSEVDTEVLLALIAHFRRHGSGFAQAFGNAFAEIEGTASVAVLSRSDDRLALATNNGSLYAYRGRADEPFFFASERYILHRFLTKYYPQHAELDQALQLVEPGTGLLIDTNTRAMQDFFMTTDGRRRARELSWVRGLQNEPAEMAMAVGGLMLNAASRQEIAGLASEVPVDNQPDESKHALPGPAVLRIRNFSDDQDPRHAKLHRCTRCIMPATMPFIDFDAEGVCNYCRTYVPHRPLGLDAVRELIAPYRRKDGGPDCLVGVSGGRDSCYGLHILKREMDLNPVAYTYDWGMITDLARRNQARLCGKLGVEHILVSADIRRKREYVRKNVTAWLKRPELGMIPLFMAGDKQYFHFADQTRRQLGVEITFLCENRLERAHFKSGFMGVSEGHNRVFNIGIRKKAAVLCYHAKQYALNPRYINASLFDTVWAFHSAYIRPHRQVQLYDYAAWNENVLVDVLRSEYAWELAHDTSSTWRIGDGTAAFYNYVYYTAAGFTENDALRSNQIREGVLARTRALELVALENRPRWESMQWYANTIGFSLNDALQVIESMPRLYAC
jgi:glucosamine--fructose-6-phosphate aminotransferase (isomerizing)